MKNNLLTVKEVAEQLPVTVGCIRSWIFYKKLPVVKLGQLVFVKQEVVNMILDKGLAAVSPEIL